MYASDKPGVNRVISAPSNITNRNKGRPSIRRRQIMLKKDKSESGDDRATRADIANHVSVKATRQTLQHARRLDPRLSVRLSILTSCGGIDWRTVAIRAWWIRVRSEVGGRRQGPTSMGAELAGHPYPRDNQRALTLRSS